CPLLVGPLFARPLGSVGVISMLLVLVYHMIETSTAAFSGCVLRGSGRRPTARLHCCTSGGLPTKLVPPYARIGDQLRKQRSDHSCNRFQPQCRYPRATPEKEKLR